MNLKELRNTLIRAAYRHKVSYDILTGAMTYQATRKQESQYKPTADKERILAEQNLTLVETGFFRGKETISTVSDGNGGRFILKTGGIDPLQKELLQVAKSLEGILLFKVPAIVKQGEGWILLEEINGRPLNDFYEEMPDWCVGVSKKVADDYQLVIKGLQRKRPLGNLLIEGQEWIFSRLALWSKPIIKASLIEFSLVQQLKRDIEASIDKEGASFFGWAHGNIIGDHLIVSDDGSIYLLDLTVVPRAGKRYHDFLRALDFMLLMSENEEYLSTEIPRWIRHHLTDFNEEEVKLIFAFRNIGTLGWDILHHQVGYTRGDVKKKTEIMIQFIRREWPRRKT